MSGTGKQLVFIVDDDEDFLLQQQTQLLAAGYDVVTAQGQKEAETLLETTTPDIAILDLMMENADGGFALCYHIKQTQPNVPVILVTGVTQETGLEFDASTEEERAWIKADVVLAKPIRFEQLTREMRRLLG